MSKRILVVNPPSFAIKPIAESEMIFAAPYAIASDLKSRGIDCQLFDFIEEKPDLDGHDSNRIDGVQRCGNFENELISKHVYYVGKNPKHYINFLKAYHPDEVWISVLFTYNWQAARLVADLTREFNPLIKIRLGGAYATLCTDHAKQNVGVDEVEVSCPEDPRRFKKISFNLYRSLPSFFPVLTSVGCPFGCGWCAVHKLEGQTMQFKDPVEVLDDIEEKYCYGVTRFKFLDSNILANYDNHLKVILQGIIKRGIKAIFRSYGGINPLFATQDKLELMAQANFVDVQIPLETINEDVIKSNNRAVSIQQWTEAVEKFNKIKRFSLSSFILCGMPEQTIQEIYKAINFVKDHGVKPSPLFFTPIPGTRYEDRSKPLEQLHPYLFPYASNKMLVRDLDQLLANYTQTGCYAPDYIKGERYISSPVIGKEITI